MAINANVAVAARRANVAVKIAKTARLPKNKILYSRPLKPKNISQNEYFMEQPQVSQVETAEIIHLANKILLDAIEGDFVELGCYKGDTSVLLAKLLKNSDKKNFPY